MTTLSREEEKGKSIPEITEEIDKPPQVEKSPEYQMPDSRVNNLEKQINVIKDIQNINFREGAYKIVCIGLVILVALFILDTVLINVGWKTSTLLNTIFEFFKYLISMLVGAIFSQKILDK